jgi:hypothetical protein
MFAGGPKTALLDDIRGRLVQAAIGAFDCRTSVGGQVPRITRRRTIEDETGLTLLFLSRQNPRRRRGVTVGPFGMMDRVEQAEYDEITGHLRGLMVLLDDRLSARDLGFVAEFIDVGELGLALEQMADALCEDEAPVARAERDDMLTLAERMNLGSRVYRALRFCPERPAQR